MSTHGYVSYGTAANASEVEAFLIHAMTANDQLEQQGRNKTPVCIWGRHGIGKTELVGDIANRLHAPIVTIAPAQFEEMGDLLGMPVVSDDRTRTNIAPPAWVPRVGVPTASRQLRREASNHRHETHCSAARAVFLHCLRDPHGPAGGAC